MKRELWFVLFAGGALIPAAACATNDDAVVDQDAGPGTSIPVPEAGSDVDAADPDAALPAADGCSAEWCAVPVDGLGTVTLNGVWGSAANDVWVVGTRGYSAHYDGTNWEVRKLDTLLSLYTVWGSGPNDVWAGNSGGSMFHWQGTKWEESSILPADSHPVIAIGGTSSDNVLALLQQNLFQNVECPTPWGFNTQTSCPVVYRLSKVDGVPTWQLATSNELLCKTLVFDTSFCTGMNGMWVDSKGDPWLVGDEGRALRALSGGERPAFDGVVDEANSIRTFDAVAGSSDNDVWAIGAAGSIRHYTGGTNWAPVDSPTGEHLRAVRSVSPTEAWAVGDNGTILHWNGTAWSLSAPPASVVGRGLYGVAVVGGDTWIVGEHLLMRHVSNSESKP